MSARAARANRLLTEKMMALDCVMCFGPRD